MVFVRVFRKMNSFRGDAAFSSWMYRMAVNVCLNYFRKENKRRAKTTNDLATVENSALDVVAVKREKPGLRPYLEEAIRKLPEGYRMVFVLYDIEGYSHKEVGEMLEISVGTSKSQLHKARKELRLSLAPYVTLYEAL